MKANWLCLAAALGLVACGSESNSDNADNTGGNAAASSAGGTGGVNAGESTAGSNGDSVTGSGGSGSVSGSTAGTTGGGSSSSNTTGGSAGNSSGATLSCDGVGVCDDNFKDTCDGMPDSCPTTQSSSIDVPTWDCSGTPPANVYAYATFPNGTTVAGANLAKGACVVFFEGAKDLFYAKWFKFGPQTVSDACSTYDGCICPKGSSLNASFDRRLYAFTWDGKDSCPQISIVDHKGGTAETALNQPVSNDCRKYLYALHTEGNAGVLIGSMGDTQPAYDLPFSYVAGSLPALKLRLEKFPKVEVACIDVQTAGALPWAQLMASDVQTNAAFKKK